MASADKTDQASKRQLSSSSSSSSSPSPSPTLSPTNSNSNSDPSSSSSGFTSPVDSAAIFAGSPGTNADRRDSADNTEAHDRLSSRSSTTNELDTVICRKPVSLRRAIELAKTGGESADSGHAQSECDGNNNQLQEISTMKMDRKWSQISDKLGANRIRAHEIERGQKGSSSCTSPLSMYSMTSNESGVLYYNREPLKLKDFCAEVRAPMDVEQFAHQAELMLDLDEVSMEGIIEAMLNKVIENEKAGNKLDQIRDAIFIPGPSMLMARTIQGFNSVVEYEDRCHQAKTSLKHDQSWLCALANLAQVTKRHMVIARFKHPINMGENAHEVRLFVLIVVPTIEKSTKDQVETGRTFATMLIDHEFRQKLFRAANETEFKTLMLLKAQQLARAEKIKNRHKYLLDASVHRSLSSLGELAESGLTTKNTTPEPFRGSGPACLEQQSGGGVGGGGKFFFGENPRTSKLFELISASKLANTNGSDTDRMSVMENGSGAKYLKQRAIRMDTISDDFSASSVSKKNGRDQQQQENKKKMNQDASPGCCCYLWNGLEFGKGAWQDFSRRVKFYPSDFKDAFVGPPRTVQKTVATIWFLYFGILLPTIAFSSLNTTQTHGHMGDLRKAIIGQAIGGLFFALLGGQPLVIIMTTAPLCLYTKVVHQMCLDYGFHFPAMYAAVGLWNGFFLIIYSLFGFSKLMKWCTRSTEEIFALFIVVAFVTDAGKDMMKSKRDILADYALPTAVILMSLVGSTIFDDIYVEKFPPMLDIHFERARIELLPWTGILTSMGLGFTLSLLFFMDQNISAAMVNAPQNRLKKGSAYHYDLLIVGLLNGCLSLFGLPMMHGVLPHSPLHARSLADIEEQVEEGHLRQVVTAIMAHILVLGSLFLIPYPIAYIPRAVLNGLFLYMAITSLDGLQVFERILLLVTEQSKYPPNHYIRRCPQRKIHEFTMLQLVQLIVMCLFGFSPFNVVEMFFPVIILLMIPFRHKIVPKYIDEKYLDALDGKH